MVGSRQDIKKAWLPPRVYIGKSSFEWQPKGDKSEALCKLPKDGKMTEAVKRQVWKAYDSARAKRELQNTMTHLVEMYFVSPQFKRLGNRTQSDYRRYKKSVLDVFGRTDPAAIKPPHIRKFMDIMGEEKPVTANRHHSFMSTLFSWADERGIIEDNPAKRVKKFPETARVRYIEDWEYQLVYEVARQSPYPYLAPMMEIAYLCRARSSEVRNLGEGDISEKGIYLKRTKGSKDELTLWTPRLQAAVEFARSLYPDAPAPMDRPLFRGRNGNRIVDSSRKTAWTRVMKLAMSEGASINGEKKVLVDRFTFHDIKAKGVSDHDSHHSGHKSAKMTDVYLRKLEEVKATD